MNYSEPTNVDRDGEALVALLRRAIEEAEALMRTLPVALECQWQRSPRFGPVDTEGRKAQGGHSDPTAETASDPARLHLSTVVKRSHPYVLQATRNLRGVRRGLEMAVAHWSGDEPPAS